jgi:hypothetical protein
MYVDAEFHFFISTLFNTVSEDAGIEPRIIVTPASAVRRSNPPLG